MTKQKIKLLFFHPYSSIGGADLSLSSIMNNLDFKKYSVDFVCIRRDKKTIPLNKNIKVYEIKTYKTMFSFFNFRKIIKSNIEKNFKKIILISNQNFANILAFFFTLGLRDKIKIIAYERNHINELNYYFSFNDKIKKIILKFLIKLTYIKFDRVITNSKISSQDLSKFINSKVITFYNPIITKKIKKIKKKKSKYFNILNIGRLVKQKDQITIIKAVELIPDNYKAKLKIIGSGPEKTYLGNYINEKNLHKKVEILNEKRKVSKFYESSDLFVLSSLYEGFPNVLIESILHGLPIISSNCKSGPSEILKNSIVPNMFKIKNHEQLSRKIIFYKKNTKMFLKNNQILQRNLQKFHYKKILDQMDSLFTKI